MKSSTICREWLNSLPPTQGYLKTEQSIGRELLLKKGMPSNKDEAWRLCNFNKLNSFLNVTVLSTNLIQFSKLGVLIFNWGSWTFIQCNLDKFCGDI